MAEFISVRPFASAHASTIVETRRGWRRPGWRHPRRRERRGHCCRAASGKWTAPVEVATGVRLTRGSRRGSVLFELRKGELALFYKVGPNPREWWGIVRTSGDEGRTWSGARPLPDGILGPIKNKPVRLADGTIIAPSSTETPQTPSTWRIHFERTRDNGATWSVSRPPASADGTPIDAIQPSILTHGGGRLQAIGRTRSGRVFETWSTDGGQTWTPVTLTELPNPSAGTDAVTLRTVGTFLFTITRQGRTPLTVALTRDGKTWETVHVLESGPENIHIRRLFKPPTVSCTSRTRGGASASSTSSSIRRSS